MLRTHFSEKSLKKYSKKNENWTIIFVHFSKNDRRIQNEVFIFFIKYCNNPSPNVYYYKRRYREVYPFLLYKNR